MHLLLTLRVFKIFAAYFRRKVCWNVWRFCVTIKFANMETGAKLSCEIPSASAHLPFSRRRILSERSAIYFDSDAVTVKKREGHPGSTGAGW